MTPNALRSPLSRSESRAASAVVGAVIAFGAYGALFNPSDTFGYLLSITAVAAVVRSFRTEPLPPRLAYTLATAAVVHLAGGLVRVGDDVLYNASMGPYAGSLQTHLLQYDHFAHAFASGVATLAIWQLLVTRPTTAVERRAGLVLCALAGLGIGAINEMIEFLTTTAHHGAHVGGYANTGWDLVANTVGVVIAVISVARRSRVSTDALVVA